MKCFAVLSIQCTIFFVATSVCLVAKDWIPQPYGLLKISNLKLSESIAAAQNTLQKAPEDANAWGNLAKVYHIHGWETEAIQCYRQATEISPTEFRWLYYLGLITYKTNPKEASNTFAKAISMNPKYPAVYVYYAYALRSTGHLKEAEQQLKRAKELDPANPFADLWLGELALADMRFNDARKYLQSALNLNPKQSEAHAVMAQVDLVLGNKVSAHQHAIGARQPTQHTEMDDPLWLQLMDIGVTSRWFVERGKRCIGNGNFERAVTELSTIISVAQEDPEVWLNYGISLFHTKEYSKAVAALESTLTVIEKTDEMQAKTPKKLDERNYLKVQSHYHLGRIYYDTGRLAEAISNYQQAIQIKPDFTEVHSRLGMTYWKADRFDEAVAQCKKAIEIFPLNIEFHQNLAEIYWQGKMYDQAAEEYEIIIKHDPLNEQALYRTGLAFLKKDMLDEALSRFQRILSINPKNTFAHGAMGIIFYNRGQWQKASDEFQQVLRLEPNNQHAQKMLEQLELSR